MPRESDLFFPTSAFSALSFMRKEMNRKMSPVTNRIRKKIYTIHMYVCVCIYT